jgi:hypothetical protein
MVKNIRIILVRCINSRNTTAVGVEILVQTYITINGYPHFIYFIPSYPCIGSIYENIDHVNKNISDITDSINNYEHFYVRPVYQIYTRQTIPIPDVDDPRVKDMIYGDEIFDDTEEFVFASY